MLHPYYEEFLGCLNARGARYVIVGAYAVAFHARPRFTKDLDVLVEPARDNARRVLSAIRDFFGGPDAGVTAEDLVDPETVVQLGVAPVRIDIIKEITGVEDFARAWSHRVAGRFGSAPTHYLSLDDLVASKAGAGRALDKADLRALRAARQRSSAPPKRRARRRRPATRRSKGRR